ncbi:MAG TPA: D-alanine--D-alanine ligase family protein [Candidatus Moranbacteria bacterium]|nr:D-alanine--D-alanine ligase family protein [Candidatus Moranbacteria bacterium]
MAKLNLAVIFGGQSGEHEVSLKSANQVMNALNPEKYNIIPIAITKKGQWLIGNKGKEYMKLNLPKASEERGISVEQSQSLVTIDHKGGKLEQFSEGSTDGNKIDLVLPIVHGPFVEDGKLQGMLEMLNLPYVFSGTLASALAMNKYKTKLIAKKAGLVIAKDMVVGKKYRTEKIVKKLNLPVVVKPIELGSSVGINIAKNEEELKNSVDKALELGSEVLLEQFIKGRELTVAVMGNKSPKALPVIEIIPKISTFFDYKAKYETGGSEEVCPANIPDEIRKKVQKYAVKVFKALGCRDLARADFILSEENGKLYFLEINTIPGMTATSLAPQAAASAGMEFSEFLNKLIGEAIKRK